jgi:hypothetical protein
MGEQIKAE